MLESSAYVRCLLVDFSKAFDRVNHVVLLKKLSKLPLPDCIFNWLIYFITGKSHTTICFGTLNLSIIQGSGLGPTFYIVL
jgi:Reverse transcriptase (RNA-dependent DNA polymerase)